jgi:hypothetical protein
MLSWGFTGTGTGLITGTNRRATRLCPANRRPTAPTATATAMGTGTAMGMRVG